MIAKKPPCGEDKRLLGCQSPTMCALAVNRIDAQKRLQGEMALELTQEHNARSLWYDKQCSCVGTCPAFVQGYCN